MRARLIASTLTLTLTLTSALACAPAPEPADDPDATQDAGADAALDASDTSDATADAGADAADAIADAGPPPPDPRAYADCAPYSVPGPYAPGVTTITVDGSPVEVWYPAPAGAQEGLEPVTYDLREWLPEDLAAQIPDTDPTRFTTAAFRDLPTAADQGPFPLVVFSHGFSGYRMQSTFLTAHLATWGFVVAAVEHPERGLAAVLEGRLGGGDGADVDAAIAAVDALRERGAADADGLLVGLVASDSPVGIVGHSAGGATSISAASQADTPFTSVVGLAPAVSGFDGSTSPTIQAPTAVLLGETDAITTEGPITTYYQELTSSPRQLVSLANGGHLVFSDICLIGAERGGIARIARERGLPVPAFVLNLAQDGCRATDLDPRAAFPIIDHMTTAHLLGTLAGQPDALPSPALAECFGDVLDAFEVVD